MKLPTKLTLLFFLFSSLPVSIVAYTSFTTSRKIIKQNMVHHLTSINFQKEAELERWINDKKRMLRSLARRPLLQQHGSVLLSDIHTEIRWKNAYKNISQEHFKATLDEEGGFMELFLMRKTDGMILISSDKSCEGKYRENKPYFLIGRNETFVQNPYYDFSRGQSLITVSTPVKSANNTVIAVLAGHVNLAELSEIMLKKVDHTKGENENTYLVNRFNFMVAGESIGSEGAMKKAIYSEGIERALKHMDGFEIYKDYRNTTVFGAYRWLPRFEMAILTEQNRDEVLASITLLRKTILILLGAITLIVILLGIYLARTITRPVGQLVKGADEFGRGNLDFRIENESKDEIGTLTAAFNLMAEKRQNAENELEKHKEHLEELVEIRTAELKQSQSQLIVAEKMSALGTMTAGIAHEMNNPMMGILNFVQYCIKHTSKDDRKYEVLQDAEKSTNDCIKIIKNLLTFSRIEKEEEEKFQKESCDSVLERVLKLLYYRIETENIAFDRYNHPDTPAILIKVTNIQQVFLNILGNALDALKNSDDKTLKIDIRPKDGFVQTTVTDSGCGILPRDFPKIYDPFFTTKPVGKGTGLGLSVCTGIIIDHGGTISCESEVGKGTSFKILLPIERA